MGYAQWVVFLVHNGTNDTIRLENVTLHWGKWHQIGDKDSEIVLTCDDQYCSPFNGQLIRIGAKLEMSSCGRENSPSGTNGEFDVMDNNGNRICHVYWDCPWGSSKNVLTISSKSYRYDVSSCGENLNAGALGVVNIKICRAYKC